MQQEIHYEKMNATKNPLCVIVIDKFHERHISPSINYILREKKTKINSIKKSNNNILMLKKIAFSFEINR